MSPTLKVNLTLFFVPYIFVGFCRFTILLLLSLTKCVFIQNLVIHDNTSLHKCLDAKCTELCFKNCHGFPQLSIIRDNPRNLIHKKCHRKSYHKWHEKNHDNKGNTWCTNMHNHLNILMNCSVEMNQATMAVQMICWSNSEAFDMHTWMMYESPESRPVSFRVHRNLIDFLQSVT